MQVEACQDEQPSELTALFTNDSYEERDFRFGTRCLSLFVSPASSTDYDLTGQVLWPGAHILAKFLAQQTSLAQYGNPAAACELGAGLGLVSLLCANWCTVVATDHSDNVLGVLKRNCGLNQLAHPIRCERMDWGSDEEVASVRACSPDHQGFQLLLGADVCYNHNAVPKLFRAVASLLQRTAAAVFLLSYISRSAAVDAVLADCVAGAQMTMQSLPGWRDMPAAGCVGTIYDIKWSVSGLLSVGCQS